MIEKTVWLACAPEAAFRLFTHRVSEWWPETHRLGKDPASELYMVESGRFFERTSDGRELEMGRLVEWVAPERLVLDFYLGTGPAQPTVVTVRFVAEGEGTRITIEHGAKPESAAVWEQRAPVYRRSWDAVLAALAKHSS